MSYKKDVLLDSNGNIIRPCTISDNVVNPTTRKTVTEEVNDLANEFIPLKYAGNSPASVTFEDGDVFYNSVTKALYKKTGGTWITVPFVDGAIYTYENKVYFFNGTTLVRAEEDMIKELQESKVILLSRCGCSKNKFSLYGNEGFSFLYMTTLKKYIHLTQGVYTIQNGNFLVANSELTSKQTLTEKVSSDIGAKDIVIAHCSSIGDIDYILGRDASLTNKLNEYVSTEKTTIEKSDIRGVGGYSSSNGSWNPAATTFWSTYIMNIDETATSIQLGVAPSFVYLYDETERFLGRKTGATVDLSDVARAKKVAFVYPTATQQSSVIGSSVSGLRNINVSSSVPVDDSAFNTRDAISILYPTGDITLSTLIKNGVYVSGDLRQRTITDLPYAYQGNKLFYYIVMDKVNMLYGIDDGTLYTRVNGVWQNIDCSKGKWVRLGDSITLGTYSAGGASAVNDTVSYQYIANKIKFHKEMVNLGVGGMGFVHVISGKNACDKADEISSTYNGEAISIAYGVNDWIFSSPLGTINSAEKDGTVYGNAKYTIKTIVTNNPKSQVFVISPMNCWSNNADGSHWAMNTQSASGVTLQQIYDAIKQVCELYNVCFIDMLYSNSVINDINIKTTLNDTVHPTIDAHRLLAREAMNKFPLD